MQISNTTAFQVSVEYIFISVVILALLDYDMLVTNPPYSGEHKVKLLDYLSSAKHNNKPFALLLPVYVISKSYWKTYLEKNVSNPNHQVAYLLPCRYYEYAHPENTGKDIPPFYSAWIIGNLSVAMIQK
jgi:hypothetical protein